GIVTDGAGAVYQHTALDLAVMAQENGAKDLSVRGNLDAVLGPHAAAQVRTADLYVDATLQHIGIRTHVFGEIANIAPVALANVAKERIALFQHVGEELLAEVKGFVLLEVAEDLGIKDIDAGVNGVAEDLTPARLLQELADALLLVGDDDAIFKRVGHAGEHQGSHRPALGVERNDVAKVEVSKRVAADDQEWLI